ncbi:lipase family protein [Nocardia yamanashiensis]|uniref:lipase family protein n=1 Tax=Nocardia yamanashiensis TaxID=209247 RepID=UPI000830B470|nr:lipase family protein [Nocardia yamanashiensis]
MRAHTIAALLVGALLAVLGTAGTGGAHAAPDYADVPIQPLPVIVVPPELDAFYNAPADAIAGTPPGGIIKARQITPAFLSVLPFNIDAWQLLYRTDDSHGAPIATVTTVLKPRGPAPADGLKLLSYQVAEDSTARYCAMSYVAQQGSIPVDYVNSAETALAMLLGISQGWAVAIPDYEGPNSAYGAAILGGRATLDGIRAAENFAPLQLTAGDRTPVGLMGYSGGTIPTGWVAEHHGEYAPELNIVGASIGGVVMGDLKAVLRSNNANLGAGLIGAALHGFATEYPEVRNLLETRFDWFGRFMTSLKGMLCHPQGSALFPFWNYLGSYTGAGDPLDIPEVSATLTAQELGKNVPDIPMYLYHAQNDEFIPNTGTDRVVEGYCRDPNARITYTRELLAEHISGIIGWLPDGYQFLIDRMNGVPVAQGCTITSPVSTLTDGDFATLLGAKWPQLAALLTGYPLGAR